MATNGYVYIGTTTANLNLAVPYPATSTFTTTRNVNSGRSASGVVSGQQVGRSLDKIELSWEKLDNASWWALNDFIEAHGLFFYCKYFNHNRGTWLTRRCYCSDLSCTPHFVNRDTGKPRFYENCTFSIVDCGAGT